MIQNKYITAYEKINDFSAEILALFNSPGQQQMNKRLEKEFHSLSAALSEGFSLPGLYNSPDYKWRLSKIIITILTLLSMAAKLEMITNKQLGSIAQRFNEIMLIVIDKDLPYPEKLKS